MFLFCWCCWLLGRRPLRPAAGPAAPAEPEPLAGGECPKAHRMEPKGPGSYVVCVFVQCIYIQKCTHIVYVVDGYIYIYTHIYAHALRCFANKQITKNRLVNTCAIHERERERYIHWPKRGFYVPGVGSLCVLYSSWTPMNPGIAMMDITFLRTKM